MSTAKNVQQGSNGGAAANLGRWPDNFLQRWSVFVFAI